jgi:hypothetical protein
MHKHDYALHGYVVRFLADSMRAVQDSHAHAWPSVRSTESRPDRRIEHLQNHADHPYRKMP